MPPLLQNQAQHTVTALQFSFLVNALAAPGLLLFYSLPRHLALRRGAKQRVPEQRGMRLIDWAQYQLGRLHRTASFQALLPATTCGWGQRHAARTHPAAAAAAAAAAETELRPRGATLRRPSLIEDTTTGGLDASLLPQAVQAKFSISKPPATRHRATAAAVDRRRLQGLRLPPPQPVSAPVTPRGWLSAPTAEPQSPMLAYSAPATGAEWPQSWGQGMWEAGSGSGSSAGTPRAGAGAAAGLAAMPLGSPRTPSSALRQPLLPATAEEDWVDVPADDLELGGSTAWLRQPARAPLVLRRSAAPAAAEAAPAAAGGEGSSSSELQPLLVPAEERGRQQGGEGDVEQEEEQQEEEEGQEHVHLTLQPFTLYQERFTPWALADSEPSAAVPSQPAQLGSQRLGALPV